MEIRQLKYFLVAAERLHFSRAADELGIAQSALSQTVRQLEAELNCRLFDRSNKWKVSLTDAGTYFSKEARRILNDLEAVKRRTIQTAAGTSGTLSLSASPSFFSSEKFFTALKTLQKKYPNIYLRLSKHSSAEILRRVENESLDFGIIRTVTPETLGTQFFEIGREKIVLAVPETHALAKKRKISIRDLLNEKFISIPYEESPFFCQLIEFAFKRCGNATPKISREIYNFDAILKLLPGTDLIAFVPELLKSQTFYTGIVFKNVSDLEADIRYVGIWKGSNTAQTLKNFLPLFRNAFRTKSERASV